MSVVVDNVTFCYDPSGPAVLRDLSMRVEPGQLWAVVGPSGGGKSTLLQVMAGLLKPTEGSVRTDNAGGDTRTALVFQYPERHFFHMTVEAELSYGLKRSGLDRETVRARLEESLEFMRGLSEAAPLPGSADVTPPGSLDDMLHRSPFALSGGEQRALAIAVAWALRPGVLLLDEPTAGLDAAARERLFASLDAWRRRWGVTVVVVSHDLEELGMRADRIAALSEGRIVFDGPPHDFFARRDVLDDLGLAAPAIPALVDLLHRRGLRVEGRPETVDAVADAIVEAAGRHGGSNGTVPGTGPSPDGWERS